MAEMYKDGELERVNDHSLATRRDILTVRLKKLRDEEALVVSGLDQIDAEVRRRKEK